MNNNISESDIREVYDLISQAKMCSSLKAVKEYTTRLRFMANYFPSPMNIKLCEICSCLESYCNQRSDTEWARTNLNNAVGTFDAMVRKARSGE